VAPSFLLAMGLEGAVRLRRPRWPQRAPRSPSLLILFSEIFSHRPLNRALLVIHAQVRSDEFAGHIS
jgi:hypothetical protein